MTEALKEMGTDRQNALSCSIGVIVYNEAGNIIPLLNALTTQKLDKVSIEQIIVVSSACTDGTDDLVKEFMLSHPMVSLISEPQRNGKSAAINLFLKAATQELCIIESGDTIPAEDMVERLIAPFADARIGATGGRPVPVNKPDTLIGYTVQTMWRMHHRMALIHPKLGEVIAFRKVFDSIPRDSAVDEASIEALERDKGLKLVYIPNAIIHNKGPENWKDWVKQRRRIQNGHLWLMHKQHYTVVSQDKGVLLTILKQEIMERPLDILKLKWVMLVEVYCRLLGTYDFYVKKRNPFTWEIAASTKRLNSDKDKQI